MTDTEREARDQAHRERALNLLRYLREFVKLRLKVVRRVEDYQREGLLAWFSNMPQDPGCTCPLWAEMGEGKEGMWLEVKKQELPRRPELPEPLEPWVEAESLNNSAGDEPELRKVAYLPRVEERDEDSSADQSNGQPEALERLDEEPLLAPRNLADHPEITESWASYLEKWRIWAEEHRRKSKIQRLYGELFRAYQTQRRLGEAYEFLVGLGLLSWVTPQKQSVRRHVVTAQAELKFDQRRGVMSVECPPPPEGANLQIEDEFLEPTEHPAKEYYDSTQEQLAEIGNGIWDRQLMDPLLTAWGTTLHPDTDYSQDLKPPEGTRNTPRLAFAPALILRRRTVRGMLAAYNKIISQIQDEGELPFGLRRLVDHLEDRGVGADPDAPPSDGQPGKPPDEILFPLSANNEQLRIVEELGRRQGVLVQGPPGTGKSQTIANLICHFLASGKRVLVTSETPRALRVLKDKIPHEVQPLCVSLLGADTASFSELESSINGISQRHTHWRRGAYDKAIGRLEREVRQGRERKAEAEREIRLIRESETYSVTLADGTYRGTAAAIAQRVNQERELHGWLSLPDDAPDDPPLQNREALTLLRALRRIPPERRTQIERPLADSGALPTPEQVADLLQAEKEAQSHAESYAKLRDHPGYEPLLYSAGERRTKLHDLLQDFMEQRRALSQRSEAWIPRAIAEVLAEQESPWKVLVDRTREVVQGLREAAHRAESHKVQLPKETPREQILADAREVHDHLSRGGRWSLLGIAIGPARGKSYLKKKIRVDGRPANRSEALRILIHDLETRQRVERLWNLWKGRASPISEGLETQVAELAEHLEALDAVFGLLDLRRSTATVLAEKPRIPAPDWSTEGLSELLAVIEAAEAATREREARAATETALEELDKVCAMPNAHPVNRALREALKDRDLGAWADGLDTLQGLERDREAWEQALSFLDRLQKAAPVLARRLRDKPDDPHWEQRLSRFEAAWMWAVADRWLNRKDDERKYRQLVQEVHDLEQSIRKRTGELAAEKAWREFLGRLRPRERESLQAWQLAVKQIGKGTGRYAEKRRAEARKYMEGCVHSIPAWIVPRYRVAEVLEPAPELFDVVIVDEASQTGIDGLFLYYLGRQTIVVGDDQQISPAGVGIDLAAVGELQRRFLEDIPFPAAFEPGASLYAHAKIKYAGRLVLREHFRCVPEIIQFSNDLCYAPNRTPLIPLRTYPPQRLQPVITRFVKGGYQEGKASSAVNRPEAEHLVAQLLACLRDERYRGKTFGVISLVGEAQARVIQHLVTQLAGPELMQERDLVCGDAYAFQGDERDVMFLSMVSAPNARIGVLAGEAAKQRFNVAASRAKDQLWLFHSVQPEDLSDKSVARRLLEYCLDPAREPVTTEEDVFESQFERDVCEAIRARGYRVRTQVEAGEQTARHYRIDLVVEGLESRLAVECDGDQWHGPQAYESDMARQRQLERAGWRFFRIRGGTFYSNPERALEPLWEELDRMGIRPRTGDSPKAENAPEPADLGNIEIAIEPEIGSEEEQEAEATDEGPPDARQTVRRPELNSTGVSGGDSEGDTSLAASRERPAPPARAEESHVEPRRRESRQSGRPSKRRRKDSYSESDLHRDKGYIDRIPAAELLEASHWAKVHEKLEKWQRGVLYTVGRNKKRGWNISDKQYRRAAEGHREAVAQGFRSQQPDQGTLFQLLEERLGGLAGFERERVLRVLQRVADGSGHTLGDLTGGSSTASLDRARKLAAFLLTARTGLSASLMKEILGFAGEEAIEEAVKEVERWKLRDPDFAAVVTSLLDEVSSRGFFSGSHDD